MGEGGSWVRLWSGLVRRYPLTWTKSSPNFMDLCKLGNYNEQRRQRGRLFEGRPSRHEYWLSDHRDTLHPNIPDSIKALHSLLEFLERRKGEE